MSAIPFFVDFLVFVSPDARLFQLSARKLFSIPPKPWPEQRFLRQILSPFDSATALAFIFTVLKELIHQGVKVLILS